MDTNTQIEEVAMSIIANSGAARSTVFEALREARKGNFEKAEEMMKSAEELINEVHRIQMGLLVSEANGEKVDINILLVHSQDHFMTSLLAFELITEMIDILKDKKEK